MTDQMRPLPPNTAPPAPEPPGPGATQPGPAVAPHGVGAATAAAMPPLAPEPAPRRSRAWVVALVAVVMAAVVCVVGISSCTSAMRTLADPFGSLETGQQAISSDCIGIIELTGDIAYDGSLCSPEGLKEQLDRAEADRHIKAVVLRVNSGGGVATAGEEMAAYVRDFSKPIVVSSAASNMSAAYEISSQADYIFVDKSTFIGSIGTALQLTSVGELLDKLGISVDNITSAEAKDSTYGTRPLSAEERAYYQAIVDQVNETFIEAVAEGRGMDVEAVRKLATGMPFTGIDALSNGLADEEGLLEDAVDKAAELAGTATDDVVYLYSGSSSLSDLLDLMGEARAGSSLALGLAAEGLR